MTKKHDTGILIRPARADEAGALTELCRAAKRHWRYPEEWMREWLAELTVTPEFVREQVVAVAERGGVLAGFYGLRRDAKGGVAFGASVARAKDDRVRTGPQTV